MSETDSPASKKRAKDIQVAHVPDERRYMTDAGFRGHVESRRARLKGRHQLFVSVACGFGRARGAAREQDQRQVFPRAVVARITIFRPDTVNRSDGDLQAAADGFRSRPIDVVLAVQQELHSRADGSTLRAESLFGERGAERDVRCSQSHDCQCQCDRVDGFAGEEQAHGISFADSG